MKILLDANIAWKLTNILTPVFGECGHVDFTGLNVPAQDIDIWNYALNNGYIIITKDNDFVDLLEIKGFPPKIVLLKTGRGCLKRAILRHCERSEAIYNTCYQWIASG